MIRSSAGFVIDNLPTTSGNMYWDGSRQCVILVDPHNNGYNTQMYPQMIGFDSDTQRVLAWAQNKMLEEFDLKRQLDCNPALREAYNNFQVLLALSK